MRTFVLRCHVGRWNMTAKRIRRNRIILLRKRTSILRLNLRKRRTRGKKRKKEKVTEFNSIKRIIRNDSREVIDSIQKIRTASEINPLTLYMPVLIHFLREMRDKRTTISPDHCITKLSNFDRAWAAARVLTLTIFRKVCASVASETITDATRKKNQYTIMRR